MSNTKYINIEIDFDVFQLITLEKRNFDESYNDALRRLLDIDDSSSPPAPPLPITMNPPQPPTDNGDSWQKDGVVLPENTQLRMRYNGKEFLGVVTAGRWKVGCKFFDSPSSAASSLARTKKGSATMLNGWKHWDVKRPNDAAWTLIYKLRKKSRTKM